MNNIIWGTCNTNIQYSQCQANMAWFASSLKDNCAQELDADYTLAVETLESASCVLCLSLYNFNTNGMQVWTHSALCTTPHAPPSPPVIPIATWTPCETPTPLTCITINSHSESGSQKQRFLPAHHAPWAWWTFTQLLCAIRSRRLCWRAWKLRTIRPMLSRHSHAEACLLRARWLAAVRFRLWEAASCRLCVWQLHSLLSYGWFLSSYHDTTFASSSHFLLGLLLFFSSGCLHYIYLTGLVLLLPCSLLFRHYHCDHPFLLLLVFLGFYSCLPLTNGT